MLENDIFTVAGMCKIIVVYFLMASVFITVNYFMKWLFRTNQRVEKEEHSQ